MMRFEATVATAGAQMPALKIPTAMRSTATLNTAAKAIARADAAVRSWAVRTAPSRQHSRYTTTATSRIAVGSEAPRKAWEKTIGASAYAGATRTAQRAPAGRT